MRKDHQGQRLEGESVVVRCWKSNGEHIKGIARINAMQGIPWNTYERKFGKGEANNSISEENRQLRGNYCWNW